MFLLHHGGTGRNMFAMTNVTHPLSLTAVMEPPMFGVMEPQTGV